MALMNCPACQHEISKEAASCPSCGHPLAAEKAKKAARANAGCAGVVVVAIILAAVIYGISGSDDPGTSKPKEAAMDNQAKAASCRADLQCWSAQNQDAAIAACAPKIEDQATHEVKWKDGAPLGMFSRVAWGDAKHAAVRYIGDEAYFQNGFGAFDPVMYTCVFDTESVRVVKVTVLPGRLSQLGLPDN